MRDKISIDLSENNETGIKSRRPYIKKHYPNDYVLIDELDMSDNWSEKLYLYVNNISEIPKCAYSECNNNANFKGYSKGYTSYCSIQCRNSDPKLKLLGEKNHMKNQECIQKSKKTRKERYGDENYNNLNKTKKTKKERYGDEYYNNREKSQATSLKKYGVSNFTNREKAKKTSKERYGNEYYNNHDKTKRTNLERYGVEYYNNHSKTKKTNLERYGVTSHTKTDEYRALINHKSAQNYAKKLNTDVNNVIRDGDMFIIKNYCAIHNIFTINKDVLKNRISYGIENVCTECNSVSKQISIKENEIRFFIENELNIKTDKIKIDNKEIDIYLSDFQLGIEFDGLYWHSNIFLDENYHLVKTELAKKNNIMLLHVFEDEWLHKKEIVKSIIKSKLGLYEQKIHIDECIIEDVADNESIEDFLNKNHIQGFVKCKINIGIYYNNVLVSIMGFNKKNERSEDNDYELLKYSNKLNMLIIGGIDEQLNYFIKKYNPKSILTFVDRRYNDGGLYEKLGFEFMENTKPNHWYFKRSTNNKEHRFKYKKDILVNEGFDPSKTEFEIMSERKYYRIFDSGDMKYILNVTKSE